MATKAFDYALEDVDLIRKAVNALQGLTSNTPARQRAICDLQILEAVLRGVQEVSLESASEDTLRNLQCCSHFCRPPLDRFLQSLKELEPDICHAPILEKSLVQTIKAPKWVIRLEREVAVLQGSVGNGLRAIDLLLRVEAMRCDVAANRTLPEDLQRIMDTLQECLRSPGKRHAGSGHCYHNIQTSDSAYSHNGDKYVYCFNSAPPSALLEALLRKLDTTAGMLQTGQSGSVVGNSMAVWPHGSAFTRVANDNTPGPRIPIPTDVQPPVPQSTPLSVTELTKLLLQSLLELARTRLNTLLAMLLCTIPAFRIFIRSLSTFARQPSMLLDSNFTLIDGLKREVSLPYQWFRNWPHMLAHLQYEFKGTPEEYTVTDDLFLMHREPRWSICSALMSVERWEDFVSPGIRIFMLLLPDELPDPELDPFCAHTSGRDRVDDLWEQCTRCSRFVVKEAEPPTSRRSHAIIMEEDHVKPADNALRDL